MKLIIKHKAGKLLMEKEDMSKAASDYINQNLGGHVEDLCPVSSKALKGDIRHPWIIDYLLQKEETPAAAVIKKNADAAYNLIVDMLYALPSTPRGGTPAELFAAVANMLTAKEKKEQKAKQGRDQTARNLEAGMFQENHDLISNAIKEELIKLTTMD